MTTLPNNLGYWVKPQDWYLYFNNLELLSISNDAQTNNYERVFSYMKPTSSFGLFHRLLVRNLQLIQFDYSRNSGLIESSEEHDKESIRDTTYLELVVLLA